MYIICLCVLAAALVPTGAQECVGASSISIISERNRTGHWILQVRSAHIAGSSNEDDKSDGPWKTVISQKASQCDAGEMVIIEATFTAPLPRPGPGYELFPGVGHFKYHQEAQIWDAARETCRREGAYLAIVNSAQESQYMAQMLLRDKKNVAFLGFHDRFVEGQFLTVLGGPLNTTGFTQWADKRLPDNGGGIPEPGADCGSIYINGGLHDLVCSTPQTFFCERSL